MPWSLQNACTRAEVRVTSSMLRSVSTRRSLVPKSAGSISHSSRLLGQCPLRMTAWTTDTPSVMIRPMGSDSHTPIAPSRGARISVGYSALSVRSVFRCPRDTCTIGNT